jgi:Leucine-rich repeat (LRR) protein
LEGAGDVITGSLESMGTEDVPFLEGAGDLITGLLESMGIRDVSFFKGAVDLITGSLESMGTEDVPFLAGEDGIADGITGLIADALIAKAHMAKCTCNYMITQELPSLELLIVVNCMRKCFPEKFEVCTNLRFLFLCGCLLESLPPSLGTSVNHLEYLCVAVCPNIKKIPQSFGNLTCLKFVMIIGCGMLEELPPEFGNLTQMREINLIGCESLQQLCEFPTKMQYLTMLKIIGCPVLKFLPATLGNLHRLEILIIQECRSLHPSSVAGAVEKLAPHLKTIKLGCNYDPAFAPQPDAPGYIWQSSQLKYLSLGGYSMQNLRHEESPASIGRLRLLENLKLKYCEDLIKLPEEIGELSQLKTLRLNGTDTLKYLPTSLTKLSQLLQLDLEGCTQLRWTEESQLSTLEEIRNHGCSITLPSGEIFSVQLAHSVRGKSHDKGKRSTEEEGVM